MWRDRIGKGRNGKEDSASGDESSRGESEVSEKEVPQQRGRSGAIKSRFSKASSTRLVKQVLHAQSMLDDDELESSGDLTLEELPFHLLVAGEIEAIMTNILEDKKWTTLNLLRQLACKSQFLENKVILDTYVAFLRKFEKGLVKWGPSKAIRDLEENLRSEFLVLLESLLCKIIGVEQNKKG